MNPTLPVSALPGTARSAAASRLWPGLRRMADSWWGAILGGGVYGAWATWANWGQGAQQASAIGLGHWTTSAMLTFFGTAAMRRFFGSGSGWPSMARAFAGGLCLTYCVLFAVHALLGTQHLWLTLAPGVIPNIVFCGSYAGLLQRTLQAAPVAGSRA